MNAAALITTLLLSAGAGDLEITGPSEAAVGSPVRVYVTGLPKFETLEEMYNFQIGVGIDKGPGCKCVLNQSLAYDLVKQQWKLMLDFTAEIPGVYVLMVAKCITGGPVQLSHRVVVGGVPPNPDPDPDPDPDPEPEPTTFAKQIKDAFLLVDTSVRKKGADIANNYRTVADQAASNPTSWTPANMLDAVKARHTTTLTVAEMQGWSEFWGPLAQAFVGLELVASDLDGHIAAFIEIAEVLNGLATTS